MRKNFYFYNIDFKQDPLSESVVMTGEITNKSGKGYNAVVFKIIVFSSKAPMGHAIMTINGFSNGATKVFEKPLPGIDYREMNKIKRWEILPESSY